VLMWCLQMSRTIDPSEEQGGPIETEKSLKMKLCLHLESLFAAMEVGVPI
jgi:hypothetical protein